MRTSTAVDRVEGKAGESIRLQPAGGEIEGTHLLVAGGRTPNSDGTGLESAECRLVKLAGDKGYSDLRIRRWLALEGVGAVIPRRKDQRPEDGRVKFDLEAYRRRAVVEQCDGWLKERRALAMRFEKLAVNFLATVKWAMIQRYLRLLAGETMRQTEPQPQDDAILRRSFSRHHISRLSTS